MQIVVPFQSLLFCAYQTLEKFTRVRMTVSHGSIPKGGKNYSHYHLQKILGPNQPPLQ